MKRTFPVIAAAALVIATAQAQQPASTQQPNEVSTTISGDPTGVCYDPLAQTTTPVNATVKVYCSNVLMTTRTRGFKTDRDMWVVGTVQFASNGTCTFTYDGYVFNLP